MLQIDQMEIFILSIFYCTCQITTNYLYLPSSSKHKWLLKMNKKSLQAVEITINITKMLCDL
jgi:hypothetical protein